MKKLIDILNEVKINSPIDKRKMFDTLHNKYQEMFNTIIQKDTLRELLEDTYDMDDTSVTLEDIEGYLIDEWKFNEDGKEVIETAKLIEQYYKCIESGDIKVVLIGKINITGYRHLELIYVTMDLEHHEEDHCIPILTKF